MMHRPPTSPQHARHRRPLKAGRRRADGESGVVAIEFALVLPFILMFLFAVIDFGQLFNNLNDSNQIAANGARFAAVNVVPGGGSLQTYLASQADTQRLKDNINVCIKFPNGGSHAVGDPVQVKVTSQFKLVPILGALNITVHGEATMRLERTPSYAADCP